MVGRYAGLLLLLFVAATCFRLPATPFWCRRPLPSPASRRAACAIKQRIYGNRIVLFAPLYIANYCVNNCRYCAFRQGNKNLEVRRGWRGAGLGSLARGS